MTELEIAGYLDRGLSDAARDRVETHLVQCSECRQNVAASQRLVQRIRRPRHVVTISALVAVAAAGVLMVRPQIQPREGSLERAHSDVPGLAVYAPTSEITTRTARFVWGGASDAVSYRLTVSNGSGATLWTQSGTDTVAILPDSVTLSPGERYVWVADAILSDGSTRSTGLTEFGSRR